MIEVGVTLEEAKRQFVLATLSACNWNISKAARMLGLYRSSLQRMLTRWQLP